MKLVHTLVLLVVLFSFRRSFAVEFQGLGGLGGFAASSISALSGDGNVVFGVPDNITYGTFRWTKTDGWTDLQVPESEFFVPFYTTYDGSLAFGFSRSGVHWTEDSGFSVGISAMPGNVRFFPGDASSDGSVFVGSGCENGDCRTGRFSESEGFAPLLDDDDQGIFAQAISGDGRVVVGFRPSEAAFRWTKEAGLSELWPIGDGVTQWNLSFDGSVIVGAGRTEEDDFLHAYRWTVDDGAVLLPDLGDPSGSAAYAVSADGSTIVGHIWADGRFEAVIWDRTLGIHRVKDVLVDSGIDIGDWEFDSTRGISDDGYVIVGNGINPDGFATPWRIVLDRGDFDIDGAFDVDDIDILAAVLRDGTQYARYDLNNDQIIDTEDYRVLVEKLANTYFGDSNFDGEFNSADIVAVFIAGQYEDDVALNSNWSQGAWNGEGEFDSSDFVLAFQGDGFERGPRAANAVPEPSSMVLACLALGSVCLFSPDHR
jgi:uncharacterized membrane protein